MGNVLIVALVFIAASAIGTFIGEYLKEMMDNVIMNRRMRANSNYLRKRREERDELAKRRRNREQP